MWLAFWSLNKSLFQSKKKTSLNQGQICPGRISLYFRIISVIRRHSSVTKALWMARMINCKSYQWINHFLLSLLWYVTWKSSEQLTQWDSPMRVKLSVWKPCVKTLLIELLPWALLINHSKWDLWLFEGEKIVLQIPSGKTMIPPNFQAGILFKTICIVLF